MKAADKVTTIRIILAPVFFIIYHFDKLFFSALPGFTRYGQILLLWIIFAAAELSDMLDGKIARKRREVSGFGKFYDPFADTLFQITLFFCFVWDRILPMIPFLLVLYREFAVLFVRNLMQKKGISMGASMGGKIKTVAYIIAGILALAAWSLRFFISFFQNTGMYEKMYSIILRSAEVVFWLAVLLSLLSFADYVRVYRKHDKTPLNPHSVSPQ
ncbi:MAG: CDP-diacylglycerol--glycerol-3-phosphate 3-phosphatidyltransferase [Treponema sp.]|nr:CDP-diacylglycerol--glycerol-3-phosphate 3-phosphatidyltransferase [Treponema sp.]